MYIRPVLPEIPDMKDEIGEGGRMVLGLETA